MTLNTYVNFSGKCAEAFRYYEHHLGGRVSMMMTHDQAPDQTHVNPDWKGAVLHARISIGGTELLGGPTAISTSVAHAEIGSRRGTIIGTHLA